MRPPGSRSVLGGAVLLWLGLPACQRQPESVYLWPFVWEDAAPVESPDAAPPDPADAGPAYLPAAAGVVPLPGAPYTVIALPDTQFYAAFYPDIFDAQIRWIAGERMLGNIAFVVHEGDLVDSDDRAQWSVATRSMQLLDGFVPYVISTGNHDYGPGGDGWTVSRSTLIDSYFPVWKYASLPWFKGTFEPDHIENNYALMDLPNGGGQWLVVSLEFGPRDEVLAWADSVVKQYPTTPVMLVTHAYLYMDNTRYDHVAHPANVPIPDQRASPYIYPIAMTSGAVNDGEEIWQKLVLGNSNIQFVLCGHVLDRGTGRLVSTRPDGTTVNQILANYQMDDYGGSGYLRIMQFFPASRTVHVRTYSPYFDEYKTDPENDFELRY